MVPVGHEPSSVREIKKMTEYQGSLALFQESGFLPFLQRFDGFDMAMALEFARTFEEGQAKVGSMEFEVMEESIV